MHGAYIKKMQLLCQYASISTLPLVSIDFCTTP